MTRLSEIIADTNWSHPRATQLLEAADRPCECGDDAAVLAAVAGVQRSVDELRVTGPEPKTTAAEVFSRAGFTGEALDIALGVAYGESSGFVDAVGDIALVDGKWGPSIGLFQIRSLRDPTAWSAQDRYRYAWALRDPDFNAQAAYIISARGTNWSLWSVYKSGAYVQYVGKDFNLRVGHKNADSWNL